MTDRTKLLVHVRSISGLFSNAITYGPDGTLDGKFGAEHPTFTHHAVSFYLAGCLAYLAGEDGEYSWRIPSPQHSDFDSFAASFPEPPKSSYRSRGVSKANLDAVAQIRNAVIHNNGDLSENRNSNALAMVTTAQFQGVVLSGSCVTLKGTFIEYIRISTYSVRNYFGEQ